MSPVRAEGANTETVWIIDASHGNVGHREQSGPLSKLFFVKANVNDIAAHREDLGN
jgi:hypothetical protein